MGGSQDRSPGLLLESGAVSAVTEWPSVPLWGGGSTDAPGGGAAGAVEPGRGRVVDMAVWKSASCRLGFRMAPTWQWGKVLGSNWKSEEKPA